MNLSKEIIIGLGFEEVRTNGYYMYRYCTNGIEPLYLEKVHNEKEFYMIYTKDKDNNFKEYGHCDSLANLFAAMMKVNHIESIKLGKELKQKEIKSMLGLN